MKSDSAHRDKLMAPFLIDSKACSQVPRYDIDPPRNEKVIKSMDKILSILNWRAKGFEGMPVFPIERTSELHN